MFGINEMFINQCLDNFDHTQQVYILIEKCSELIKAVLKKKRNDLNDDDIVEEMSHVAISMAVVSKIYGISQDDIDAEVMKKAKKYHFDDNEHVMFDDVIILPNGFLSVYKYKDKKIFQPEAIVKLINYEKDVLYKVLHCLNLDEKTLIKGDWYITKKGVYTLLSEQFMDDYIEVIRKELGDQE